MTRVALRGLLGRKLRAALTAIAIVLGVAMISGTYVLTDTINAGFDTIFQGSYKNSDVVVTGKRAFSSEEASATETPSVPASVLAKIKRLPDVAAAAGTLSDETTFMIGKDGKVVETGGAPAIGLSIDEADQQFNPLDLVAGHWPHGGSEVVIDKATADSEGFKVGDAIRIEVNGPARDFVVAGVVKYGAVNSIGSATIAGFDTATAQQLFKKSGQFDVIRVQSKAAVSTTKLLSEIEPLLPATAVARDAQAQVKEDKKDVGFVDILQKALLAFGGIALFVGAFVIANTLSITIAQRMREFATLRTIGASRRQVLRSVILEALIVGVLGSVVGLFAGLGLAKGLNSLFVAVGIDLPQSSTVFATRTIVVALVVGILITLLASLRPALRATRVPPIAAVREGSVLPPGRFHRFRSAGAALVAVVGVALCVLGLFLDGLSTTAVLLLLLAGVLLIFIGIALFSDRLVRPLAAAADPVARWAVVAFGALAWPLFVLPYWLMRRGVWGPGSGLSRAAGFVLGAVLNPVVLLIVLLMALRRRIGHWRPEWPGEFPGIVPDRPATGIGAANSRRNPQRTASTAAALMIGLALVTLVATLGAGIIKPFEDAVDRIFSSDYAITAQSNFNPLPPSVAAAAANVQGVEALSSVRGGQGRAFGKTIQLTAVDPQAPEV